MRAGAIRPGMLANLLVLDTSHPALWPNHDPLRSLLSRSSPRAVFVCTLAELKPRGVSLFLTNAAPPAIYLLQLNGWIVMSQLPTSKTNHHVNLRRSLCFSDVSASIAGLLVAGKWVGERGNFQRSILQSKLYQVAAVAHGVIPLLQCPARNGPLADPEICHAGTPQGGRQPVPSSTQAHWAHARRMRAQCGSDKAFDTKF